MCIAQGACFLHGRVGSGSCNAGIDGSLEAVPSISCTFFVLFCFALLVLVLFVSSAQSFAVFSRKVVEFRHFLSEAFLFGR